MPPHTNRKSRNTGRKSHRRSDRREVIHFYYKHEPYYEFTNFSPHSVMYQDKRYPTSEHLYQAFKFLTCRPDIAESIRTCSERPSKAFNMAQKYRKYSRPDWKKVSIRKMNEVLELKFLQDDELAGRLLLTDDAILIENSPDDYFWGAGADGTGRNELGKALERLREYIRDNVRDLVCDHCKTHLRDPPFSFCSPRCSQKHAEHVQMKLGVTFSSAPFSNFLPYQVEFNGRIYPTAQHLYEAFKFMKYNPDIAEYIRTVSIDPMQAVQEASRYDHLVRRDWSNVEIDKMEQTLGIKFNQHSQLVNTLLLTGDVDIVHIGNAPHWGVGPDGRGANNFGKCLMNIREMLRQRRGLRDH